jgi:hypothetical protein
MNPLLHAANIGAGVASLAFFVAFILTLCPSRKRIYGAAILFTFGTWISLGILAKNYSIMALIAYGASDSGSLNTAGLFWLLLPVTAMAYAWIVPIFLWPSIPQATAMRYGKILNLILIPLLIALLFIRAYVETRGYFLGDQLKWLVYPLMWFRIRESYAKQT